MHEPAKRLHLSSTLAKRELEFASLDEESAAREGRKPIVTMYTCGPTVYSRPHIGNYSAFLMADLLRRWLEVLGYDVRHVKNITDVGHLAADRDEGEDKIEKQAREEHGSITHDSVIAIARKYESQYLEDERLLNMLEPAARPRASEYVEQMKQMIEQLLQDGVAYRTRDGIYFDVTQFPHYGSLSGNTVENLSAGARVEVNEEKRHPADFALWKFCVGPNEHHVLRWSSPTDGLPDGFPGWHIECSAMSRALLGDTIDLHTGGEDNIFPHHECEIAQSESVTNKPFVRYWLHRRRIDMGEEKMSKSLGNVLTISDIVEKGYSPMDVRYYLLSVHYRTRLRFAWKGLDDARKERRKITDWIAEVEKQKDSEKEGIADAKILQLIGEFTSAMNEDLNVPAARAAVFELLNYFYAQQPFNSATTPLLREFVQTLRHTFGCFDVETTSIPEDVQALVDDRAAARSQKNFAESDRLRDEIAKRGFVVKDTAEGQKVSTI